MQAAITAIEYYLPRRVVTNEQLSLDFPEWTPAKIEEKTGIVERHIADENECSSDLAARAAQKLFASDICGPSDIDFLLLCTQSPDYFLPTTACVLQDRLSIPVTAGALDFNLGCSGFVYGLSLAKGLIETNQARNVLLITAETYSKFMHRADKSVRTLFGDGAAATLVQGVDSADTSALGPFVFGTDGRGADNLIVPIGGMRQPYNRHNADQIPVDVQNDIRSPEHLFMNGPEIFTFTLQEVPRAVSALLARSGKSLPDIDLFVFHQANLYILQHLRKKLKIPEDKFYIALREFGNTVSATIPIALKQAAGEGRLRRGDQVMLVGFGVGYSWAAALVRWAA